MAGDLKFKIGGRKRWAESRREFLSQTPGQRWLAPSMTCGQIDPISIGLETG